MSLFTTITSKISHVLSFTAHLQHWARTSTVSFLSIYIFSAVILTGFLTLASLTRNNQELNEKEVSPKRIGFIREFWLALQAGMKNLHEERPAERTKLLLCMFFAFQSSAFFISAFSAMVMAGSGRNTVLYHQYEATFVFCAILCFVAVAIVVTSLAIRFHSEMKKANTINVLLYFTLMEDISDPEKIQDFMRLLTTLLDKKISDEVADSIHEITKTSSSSEAGRKCLRLILSECNEDAVLLDITPFGKGLLRDLRRIYGGG